MARAEGYREFLDRVHRTDVEQGTGAHKPGHCKICDEIEEGSDMKVRQCIGTNANGKRCARKAKAPTEGYLCAQHQHQDGVEEASL